MSSSRPFATSTGSYGTSSSTVASAAKSHVLAGVQDAYWSDDEADDNSCPLCLEEMDLSDLNFKPCTCGYQICRFCWHHIKENLNGRCPACRRAYTEEGVSFKPISSEDQKRLNQQKRQRERERKELEHLKRSHLVNMRVVQRNLVYVTGMGSRFAKEELIPTLRSTEYFGKYGKISKIVLVKRTDPNGNPVVGMYITYHRREDAARAIAAVDLTASPGGENTVVRASYGTTKYCLSFLRNVPCTNHGCLHLHEWGDDKDSFTKQDLSSLKHAQKETDRPQVTVVQSRTKEEEPDAPALPRSASWGQKGGTPVLAPAAPTPLVTTPISNGRTARATPRARNASGTLGLSGRTSDSPAPATTRNRERKSAAPSSVSSLSGQTSRPSTPSSSLPPRPSAAVEAAANAAANATSTQSSKKVSKPERSVSPVLERKPSTVEKVTTPVKETKPTPKPPVVVEDEPSPVPASARVQDIRQESIPPLSPASTAADSLPSNHTPPPPPGLPMPSQPAQAYQVSNQARALMDDLLNRRSSKAVEVIASPFPDFDRTLENLGDGSFSFSLTSDPKVARLAEDELGMGPTSAPNSFDPFAIGSQSSGYQQFIPPGFPPRRPPSSSGYANSPLSSVAELDSRLPRSAGSLSYAGSFNPFSEGERTGSPALSQTSGQDDDPVRRGSKFGFARKESTGPGSSWSMLASASSSPLRYADALPSTPMFTSPEASHPKPQMPLPPPGSSWAYNGGQEFNLPPPPGLLTRHDKPSPRLQYQPPASYSNSSQQPQQQQHSFTPFNQGMGAGAADLAINLHDLLSLDGRQSDRTLLNHNHQHDAHQHHQPQHQQMFPGQNYIDPAIMSMSMQSGYRDPGYLNGNHMNQHQMNGPLGLGNNAPPPGLTNLEILQPSFGRTQSNNNIPLASPNGSNDVDLLVESSPSSPVLSPSDFPSLPTSVRPPTPKERTPLNLPNLQPLKSIAISPLSPTSSDTKSPYTPSMPRQFIPLPPKPSAETLEAASKQDTKKPPATSAPTAPEPVAPPPEPLQPPPAPPTISKSAQRKAAKQKTSSPATQVALLPVIEHEAVVSRKTKKNKPVSRPVKVKKDSSKPKNDDDHMTGSIADSHSQADDGPMTPARDPSVPPAEYDEVMERFKKLAPLIRDYHLENIAFFNEQYVNVSNPDMGYESLVRALSALSNEAPINSLPVEAIDAAVTSFQQLLEMLSQTISDLLRLLPRLTWTDTASLDAMLKDMIRSGEFMEEDGLDAAAAAAEAAYDSRTDDVAALTDALSKRARWMEAQLIKLESLHHDVNSAAVRVVMYFSDRGWDRSGALPRSGQALARFDALGTVKDGSETRKMSVEELEAAFENSVHEEAEVEAKLRDAIMVNKRLLSFSAH